MLDCGKPVMEQPFNYFTGKILCNEPLWFNLELFLPFNNSVKFIVIDQVQVKKKLAMVL
jgi:hypothetical protein